MALNLILQRIRNAIEAEYAAARFYERLRDITAAPITRSFFARMVEVELEHARLIGEQVRLLNAGMLPAKADRDMRTVETVPQWAHAKDISFDQALDIALEAENRAAAYYEDIAERLPQPFKDFFMGLAATERQHARFIEELLDTLRQTGEG